MARIIAFNSCAVAELASISSGSPRPRKDNPKIMDSYPPGSPEDAIQAYIRNPPGTAVVFSDPEPYAYGPKLAAFIRRHKLGVVRFVEGLNYRYKDGHKVKVYLWLPDKDRIRVFENKMIDSGKWDKHWRRAGSSNSIYGGL